MTFLRRALLVLCTGYLLMFYSELIFWARPGAFDASVIFTIILYSLAAFVLLDTITTFRVRNIWSLFIAGAIFGWVIEGIVAGTLYGAGGEAVFPLSISWTGLAWHSLITVIIGWRGSFLRGWESFLHYALVGAAYGFWAMSWWAETEATPFLSWMAYSLVITLVMMLSLWLRGNQEFRPTWAERVIVWTLLIAWFLVVTMPRSIMALLLPALLGIAVLTLLRNRKHEKTSILQELGKPSLLTPLFIPVFGGIVYGALMIIGTFPSNLVVYLVTMPVGFLMLLLSAWKIWRQSRT